MDCPSATSGYNPNTARENGQRTSLKRHKDVHEKTDRPLLIALPGGCPWLPADCGRPRWDSGGEHRPHRDAIPNFHADFHIHANRLSHGNADIHIDRNAFTHA